jgi:hypothetical protein
MTVMDVNERWYDEEFRIFVFLSFSVVLLAHKSTPR